MRFYTALLLAVCFFALPPAAKCQTPSFQMSMDIAGHRLGDLMVNEEDQIIALFYGPPYTIFSRYLYLMDVTNGVDSQNAIRLSIALIQFFKVLRNQLSIGQGNPA
ncbi:MAG: hypothetical protein IPJ00_06250 [Saprospirales bacterium]|nr:hypothetical protein [Saprospirales bacterium]